MNSTSFINFFNQIQLKIKSNSIYTTLKHTNNYFIANIFNMGLSIITLPLFTILMSTAEIGIYTSFVAVSGFLIVIFSFNLYSGVGRYYFEEKNDFDEFLSSTILLTILSLALFSLIVLLFNTQIDIFLNLPHGFTIILFFFSIFLILESIYNQILIASRKSVQYVILSSSKFFIILMLSLVLVYELTSDKYWGRIWPLFIITGIYALYYIKKILSYTKFKIKVIHIKYILFFCVPLIPYSLSSLILNSFDRIFINATVGSSQSGLYSVGYTVGAVISLWVTAVNYAQTPEFFKTLNSKDENQVKIYFLLIKRLFSLLLILAFALIIYSKDLIDLFLASKYHESYIIVPPVVVGYIFLGLFLFYNQYITYSKKTTFSSIILLFSGLINIILNVWLIPVLGYQVASYTTLISYFFLFFFSLLVSKFILKMSVIPIKLIVKPFIAFVISILIFIELTDFFKNFLVLLILKSIVLIIFSLIVFRYEILKLISNNN